MMPGKTRLHGNRFTTLSRGLIRQRGVMNRAETKWAEELEAQKLGGVIADWWYEPLTLRLSHPDSGQPAKLTPDFLVLMTDGTTYLDDVKGSGPDDNASMVRMKAAAELYPLWRFRIVKRQTKKQGGGWKITEV